MVLTGVLIFQTCLHLVFIDTGNYQDSHGNGEFTISKTAGELGNRHEGLLNEAEAAAAAEERETHSFEIDPAQVIWFSKF